MTDRSIRRHFPAPWAVTEVAEAFVVVDAAGTRLAFIYFDEVVRGANATRKLKPAALRVATAVASLPDLVRGADRGDTGCLPPGPWMARDRTKWFSVEDVAGMLVAAVYVDEKVGRLTWDEARRIAAGVARLGVPRGAPTAEV